MYLCMWIWTRVHIWHTCRIHNCRLALLSLTDGIYQLFIYPFKEFQLYRNYIYLWQIEIVILRSVANNCNWKHSIHIGIINKVYIGMFSIINIVFSKDSQHWLSDVTHTKLFLKAPCVGNRLEIVSRNFFIPPYYYFFYYNL